MAPRKEKTEKTNTDQGSVMILDYLRKQNRPYSANDISLNLHSKVTKTNAVKVLKELHDQNVIAGKTAGKQIVYHALQNSKDAATPQDLAAMDNEIADLREKIATVKSAEKLLKANLSTLNATMSAQDLGAAIPGLETKKKEFLERLGPLRSGSVKPVSPEEKAEVDKAWKLWNRRANVRKKICMEIWAMVTEEMPEGKTKEELWDERGLEGDEK